MEEKYVTEAERQPENERPEMMRPEAERRPEDERPEGARTGAEKQPENESLEGARTGAERRSGEESPETTEVPCCEACCRTKHRDSGEYQNLMNRLKRIEGQVRGIQGMVEEERYCVDILTQVSAVQSALNSFNKALLSNHIRTCVVQDIREGRGDAVDELCSTIQRLMK